MRTSDFEYNLPPSFIAQTPLEPRDASRLLVLRRDTGTLEHAVFRDIGKYLHSGDLLVLNQTRVIPARLFARKPTGGRVELLLLRREDTHTWECTVGGKGLKTGIRLLLEENGPEAEIVGMLDGARRLVRFARPVELYLPRIGHVPLPPYIHEPLANPERYQTVYARDPGSAAAPTAGLHFTPSLLDELQSQGIKIAYVTLHIGLDTFAPVTEVSPEKHPIHTEWCELPQETADAIHRTRQSGGRVIAVGTTSVRTLESAAVGRDTISSYTGNTNLFILPGYKFKVVDCMITNFHLPRSTLIMLVSAFAGRERILHAYEIARREKYRFYSFGDAMFIT
ncbi:tRNA preQ1(34) S-adenosylmethionine ribosyltransferase-isomerase QueA [bacterium]|nr:tRNA preQ1(34) S-adenosylmethionine ribosyltransferase-isomerase QueA [bacterium]OIO89780.1 MAG: tRNA preQ1(34) S-adenosylmethionine ribosyltransferase-isomerase QueA [Anaerolineae bacterium CG2_30_58_95]PIU90587.1 MAG: tRNA preQ1(34) S-adenosylmethionine ribosyltransferase-isomerase QueA [Anaerolineae bacterium CG06_land_8_20_14_3_00_57_67]PIW19987.1 MAG: tRNA preQ1(34) S-adenosylmethionine ribosyltransferase-isomerase QueA [Anaerolineae bacterium CG17_big_fil_post_rev_8_21_14_2_50_57_27]PJ